MQNSAKFKNLLITGGDGFIGSNFVLYLLKQYKDINIVNLDKLTYAANSNNLKSIENDPRYLFVKGDICDAPLVTNILKTHNIDTVVHFAAESHVDRSINDADQFIQTNIVGTHTLLDACKNHAKKNSFYRFHHISTDEVYGSLNLDEDTLGFTESSPFRPSSPYAASKASSDHLVRAYYKTYGLPVTISNCSNNYGRFQHTEKLIPKIINACIHQKEIPIYGEGKNIRDWLHVDDHCQAIDLILQSTKIGETYNIGGNNELDNLTLAITLCKMCDELLTHNPPCQELITFVGDRLGHDWRYAVDTTKIQASLGWKPRAEFSSQLSRLIKRESNALYNDPQNLDH